MENSKATPAIGFATLRDRLVASVRKKIQDGHTTERQLAQRCGISQPHVHNALKGVRTLSVESADILLSHLQISLFDLFDRRDIIDYLERTQSRREQYLQAHGLTRKGPQSEEIGTVQRARTSR